MFTKKVQNTTTQHKLPCPVSQIRHSKTSRLHNTTLSTIPKTKRRRFLKLNKATVPQTTVSTIDLISHTLIVNLNPTPSINPSPSLHMQRAATCNFTRMIFEEQDWRKNGWVIHCIIYNLHTLYTHTHTCIYTAARKSENTEWCNKQSCLKWKILYFKRFNPYPTNVEKRVSS